MYTYICVSVSGYVLSVRGGQKRVPGHLEIVTDPCESLDVDTGS